MRVKPKIANSSGNGIVYLFFRESSSSGSVDTKVEIASIAGQKYSCNVLFVFVCHIHFQFSSLHICGGINEG